MRSAAAIASEIEAAVECWSPPKGPASSANIMRCRQLRTWAVELRAIEGEESELRQLLSESGVLERLGRELQTAGTLIEHYATTIRERMDG